MIKQIVTVLVFGVLFLGLTGPQDSLEALKPNLNAAQSKSSAKSEAKKAGAPDYAKHARAKEHAIQKIREAQGILDRNFGPRAPGVNAIQNQMNQLIPLIRQVRD